jgi:hypothetical protein
MDLASVKTWMSGEWAVIAQAPVTFIAAIVVVGFIIWKVAQHQHATELANHTSSVSLLEKQVADYKDKLSGASPDQAKARIEKLEAQVTALMPRRLSSDQKNGIIPVLSPSPGAVSVGYDIGWASGARFQRDIMDAFSSSGWQVGGAVQVGAPSSPKGILLRVAKNGPASQAVIAAFNKLGLSFDVTHAIDISDGAIDIF